MEKNILVLETQEKISSIGKKYTRVKDYSGEWFTIFDAKVADVLRKCAGTDSVVTCEIDGNVIKHTNFVSPAQLIEQIDMTQPKQEIKKEYDRYQTIWVSYVKDIFVALINSKSEIKGTNKEIMEVCIDLVKQAKEAFK